MLRKFFEEFQLLNEFEKYKEKNNLRYAIEFLSETGKLPAYEKFVRERTGLASNEQENSEPKLNATEVVILSQTTGGREKLREMGYDI